MRSVVFLSGTTMLLEIIVGWYTHSMALLADGWHMASHVFTLGLTWAAYIFIRKIEKSRHYHLNQNKTLALSGFTSAVFLLVVALLIAVESIENIVKPKEVAFHEALIVAVLGLFVNGVSVLLLKASHHKHDHNLKAAYLHVLADCLTSVFAIFALSIGIFYKSAILDACSGIVSAIIIGIWAVGLVQKTALELIDFSKSS
ncbi:MAG: cation diffusion facilitator family transporter [Cytophagales bacterium]|nr:cation diffusion facilitator family transporter [Cytophagales bacterium]MDW8384320.1 cation diffusion facilitator family transporter [Flammeovirgaceae bacterium]